MDTYDSDAESRHSSSHRRQISSAYSNFDTGRPQPAPRNKNSHHYYADSGTGSRSSSGHGKYSSNFYTDRDTSGISDHGDDQPLPLIELKRENGVSNKLHLLLHHETLDEVLITCQNRKMCCIFVTGTVRSGKSFILNCIIDKLQDLENDRKSRGRQNKEFTGFPFKAEYQGVTKGIWVWSRAFCVTTNDDEIAVLLFDTEGIDDELTKPDEIFAILGLSLLSSSLLIFNTSGSISPFELEWIFPLCDKADREQLPELSVLIRDWTDSAKFDYNGMSYLESILKQMPAAKNSQIQWNCTVLPHIGESALLKDYRGRESVLDKEFRNHLYSYLDQILNKRNLAIKSIFRNVFTKKEFSFFFTEAVSFIDSALDASNNLDAINLWSGLNDCVYKFKTQNGIQVYNNWFQDLQQIAPGGYLQDSVIENSHREAEEKAIQAFKAFRFRPTEETKLLNLLRQKLDGLKTDLKDKNSYVKNSTYERALDNALQIFQKEIQTCLPLSSNDHSGDDSDLFHYDGSILAEKTDQAKQNAEKYFLAAFPGVGGEEKTKLLSSLHKKLGKLTNDVNRKNAENWTRAREKAREVTEKFVQEYDAQMQSHLRTQPNINDVILQGLHYLEMQRIENKFTGIKLGSTNFTRETIDHIKNSIDKKLEDFKQSLKPTTHNITPELQRNTYEQQIYAGNRSNSGFEHFHEISSENATKFFSNTSRFGQNPQAPYRSFAPNFDQPKHVPMDANMKLTLEKAIADAKNQYKLEIENQKDMLSQAYFGNTELQQVNKSICNNILSRLSSLYDLNSNQRTQLEEALFTLSKKFVEQNEIIKKTFTEDIAIGIDLGTTYCCVAAYNKGKVEILRNGQGENTTPSYVLINKNGSTIVGTPAKDKAFRNPESTIYDAKRIIGRRPGDPKLQEDMKFWPFNVKPVGDDVLIEVHEKDYHPEEISAMVLRHLKEDAQQTLGMDIKKAVITVPAYFSDGQRQATIEAGELAGLEVLGILNEPTAAALAYRLECFDVGRKRKILVYDFGGGTFDVSILSLSDSQIEVLGISGDTHLGGEDIDKNLMEHCAVCFQDDTGIDLFEGKDDTNRNKRNNVRRCLNRLLKECEKTKKSVSGAHTASSVSEVSIDAFAEGEDLVVELNRKIFDDINLNLYRRTIEITENALKSANLTPNDIDDVVMVGGTTRIKKVQEIVSDYFGGKTLCNRLNPDEAIAYGAAVQAASLNCRPGQKLFDFGTIQEVTPMSLGVQLMDKSMDIIIPRNTKIPTTHTEEYKTHVDGQTSVVIPIYQGEDENTEKNTLLGTFNLKGIPPGPAGSENVDVTMTINKNGILTVEAVCRSTKGKTCLTISDDRGGYNKAKKERLLAEAR